MPQHSVVEMSDRVAHRVLQDGYSDAVCFVVGPSSWVSSLHRCNLPVCIICDLSEFPRYDSLMHEHTHTVRMRHIPVLLLVDSIAQ